MDGSVNNTFVFRPGWGHDIIDYYGLTALAPLGLHSIVDLTQTIVNGNDVISSSHTGSNSILVGGVGGPADRVEFSLRVILMLALPPFAPTGHAGAG